uniref:DNA primase n=1 Tax=viral metagenome TaxID=1070528 RepID=A0A6C0JWX7_9ZZZZ
MSVYIDAKYVNLISYNLRNFKRKNEQLYQASCPFCGDSKKDKTKARLFIFKNKNSLFVKCFNCGKSTTFANLLKYISPILYSEYVLETYSDNQSLNPLRTSSIMEKMRFDNVSKQKSFNNAEWCDKLPENHVCVQYLQSRKIPIAAYSKLLYTANFKELADEIYIDHGKTLECDSRLVIPMYDKYHVLYGIAGRALYDCSDRMRYITLRTNDSEDKLVYGVDQIDSTKDIRVVEGQLDSLFIDNCIAVCCAELNIAEELFPKEKLILIPDNEPRAPIQVKKIKGFIKKGFNVVLFPEYISQKDVNLMIMNGVNDLENIIVNNTFQGIRAELEFAKWSKCV